MIEGKGKQGFILLRPGAQHRGCPLVKLGRSFYGLTELLFSPKYVDRNLCRCSETFRDRVSLSMKA